MKSLPLDTWFSIADLGRRFNLSRDAILEIVWTFNYFEFAANADMVRRVKP